MKTAPNSMDDQTIITFLEHEYGTVIILNFDISGFSAIPCGSCTWKGLFSNIGTEGRRWSAGASSFVSLTSQGRDIQINYSIGYEGLNIRCVRNY